MNAFKLGIAIPSYNRGETLDFFFEVHISRLKKFNVPVYITNNASTDNTLDVLKKWKEVYPNIFWETGLTTVHADHNVQKALAFAKSEYVWLLGDSYEIPEISLERAIAQLEHDCSDIFVLNLVGRHAASSPIMYDNASLVSREISYLVSCIGCLIFNKSKLDFTLFELYRGSDFGHFGYVFHYISQCAFKLTLLSNVSIVTLKTPQRKKPWSTGYFEIIFAKFPKLVLSLPQSYSENEKIAIIKLFLYKSGLLGWRNLMNVRASNNLTQKSLSMYKKSINQYSSWYTRQIINVLLYIPVNVCRFILFIVEGYRRYFFKVKSFLGIREVN
ncbi:glycosyltransferase [Pseudoalteromonas neustonica]|uniref:glycosyltransferase n=1 Tax=Pseudoalteromonas neustonica TaxID=1840331 RepID=UPI0007DB35DD|nr:glycosyltransferase family 2 protein [Pseudoalteromonas neustonica]